jgi:hypothetical protein
MSGRIVLSPAFRREPSVPDPSRGKLLGFFMLLDRRTVACLVWMLLLAPVFSGAQPRPAQSGREDLIVRVHTFKHKRAADAVPLISSLLTQRGVVELPGNNTIVIRDTLAAVSQIVPVLHRFDHPARPLRLDVFIVKATRSPVSPPIRRSDLPEPITRRLREVLNYDVYEMQAEGQIWSMEGQEVVYRVGDFEVSFRVGTMLDGGRVKLSNFRIYRQAEGPTNKGLHTNLNLVLGKTMSLGLAKSETSREALMVVLTLRAIEVERRPR